MILIYTIIIIKELKGASHILLRSNGIRKIWKIKRGRKEKKNYHSVTAFPTSASACTLRQN